MKILSYVLIFISGVLGSMGMGGGTILIPAMVFCMGINQHLAQTINLVAFIPLATISIILHAKNKLIKFKPALLCALVASISGVVTSFFAQKISGKVLSVALGVFLISLGAIYLFVVFKKDKAKVQMLKNLS